MQNHKPHVRFQPKRALLISGESPFPICNPWSPVPLMMPLSGHHPLGYHLEKKGCDLVLHHHLEVCQGIQLNPSSKWGGGSQPDCSYLQRCLVEGLQMWVYLFFQSFTLPCSASVISLLYVSTTNAASFHFPTINKLFWPHRWKVRWIISNRKDILTTSSCRKLHRTPVPHIRVPGFKFSLHPQVQLPINMHPGR